MAVAGRLLRSSKPLQLNLPSSLNSGSSSTTSVRCSGKVRETGETRVSGNGGKKLTVAVKASAVSETITCSEPQTKNGVDLPSIVRNVTDTAVRILRPFVKRKSWRFQGQMLIERAIFDTRFFALFAVAGSLLGSILCFVEGFFLVLESYFSYFHTMSQSSDQGHIVHLLIEATDMFLVGTAMLVFGTGIYVLFVGSKVVKRGSAGLLPQSNLFGLFQLKMLPAWVEMQSITQAKSKIGHAVMMILQAGMLEKFNSVPLVTGLDLACFAGAVLVSSACVFILSRLSMGGKEGGN